MGPCAVVLQSLFVTHLVRILFIFLHFNNRPRRDRNRPKGDKTHYSGYSTSSSALPNKLDHDSSNGKAKAWTPRRWDWLSRHPIFRWCLRFLSLLVSEFLCPSFAMRGWIITSDFVKERDWDAWQPAAVPIAPNGTWNLDILNSFLSETLLSKESLSNNSQTFISIKTNYNPSLNSKKTYPKDDKGRFEFTEKQRKAASMAKHHDSLQSFVGQVCFPSLPQSWTKSSFLSSQNSWRRESVPEELSTQDWMLTLLMGAFPGVSLNTLLKNNLPGKFSKFKISMKTC